MRLYSSTSVSFIHRLEQKLRDILKNEVCLPVGRTRFEYLRRLYPINVVVFEDAKKLGYFKFQQFQIGLNKTLMYQAQDKIIHDILRHELAHYLCWIEYGHEAAAHGPEFRALCQRYGWGEEVFNATMDLIEAQEHLVGNIENEKLLLKLKKLLNLANSDNVHEAELATLKANQLLLEHNLAHFNPNEDEEEIWVEAVMVSTKKSAKMEAISSILEHFMVKPVLNFGHKNCALEVTGTRSNVEFAGYLAQFLERELEQLWKRETELKGLRAKNSFFLGVAQGFKEKMLTAKQQFTLEAQRALIIIERKLDLSVEVVYRTLRASHSEVSIDRQSLQRGHQAGRELQLRRPVGRAEKVLFIDHLGRPR